MKDFYNALTIANAAIFLLMLFFFITHGVSKGMIIDRITPVLFWSWIICTPFVGGAALTACKKADKRGHILLNSFLVLLWAIGLVGSLLLH